MITFDLTTALVALFAAASLVAVALIVDKSLRAKWALHATLQGESDKYAALANGVGALERRVDKWVADHEDIKGTQARMSAALHEQSIALDRFAIKLEGHDISIKQVAADADAKSNAMLAGRTSNFRTR